MISPASIVSSAITCSLCCVVPLGPVRRRIPRLPSPPGRRCSRSCVEPAPGGGVDQQVADLDDRAAEQGRGPRRPAARRAPGQRGQGLGQCSCAGRRRSARPPAPGPPASPGPRPPARPASRGCPPGPGPGPPTRRSRTRRTVAGLDLALEQLASTRPWRASTGRSRSVRALRRAGVDSTIRAKRKSSSSISSSSVGRQRLEDGRGVAADPRARDAVRLERRFVGLAVPPRPLRARRASQPSGRRHVGRRHGVERRRPPAGGRSATPGPGDRSCTARRAGAGTAVSVSVARRAPLAADQPLDRREVAGQAGRAVGRGRPRGRRRRSPEAGSRARPGPVAGGAAASASARRAADRLVDQVAVGLGVDLAPDDPLDHSRTSSPSGRPPPRRPAGGPARPRSRRCPRCARTPLPAGLGLGRAPARPCGWPGPRSRGPAGAPPRGRPGARRRPPSASALASSAASSSDCGSARRRSPGPCSGGAGCTWRSEARTMRKATSSTKNVPLGTRKLLLAHEHGAPEPLPRCDRCRRLTADGP